MAVELAGRRIDELAGRQGRLLFAYLVTNRLRPVGRGELANVLWPEEAPRAAETSLSGVLSRLRRALGEGVLQGRSELRLVLPADARIDVETAFEEIHRAQSAVALADWPRAWVSARIALHVSRRVFLPGYEGEWIDQRRRHLAALQASALECVGEAALALEGAETAAAERSARALIELDPYLEAGYRLLMRALQAGGNTAAALNVYDELRRRLREELGVPPSRETQDLHRQLLTT